MISNNLQINGLQLNEYVVNGVYSSAYVNRGDWGTVNLAVLPGLGLVQGNRKTPNDFGYTKTRIFGITGAIGNSVIVSPERTDSSSSSGAWGSANSFDSYVHIPAAFERTDDRALNKLYDAIFSGPNLAIDLLEGGQTLKMLKNVLEFKRFVWNFLDELAFPSDTHRRTRKKRVINPYNVATFDTESDRVVAKAMKGRRLPRRHEPGYYEYQLEVTRGQRRLDYLNERWLDARYGWIPIVNSIYDTAAELTKALQTEPQAFRFRASDIQSKTMFTGAGTYSDPTVKQWFTTETRSQFIGYMLPTSGLDISDFTSMNPVGIAYELMTLSFVLDWFVDFGSYIQNVENWYKAAARVSRLTRSRSYKQTYSLWLDGSTSSSTRTDYLYGSLWGQRTYHRREANITLPFPNLPRFEPSLTVNRLLDTCALIGSASKRSRKLVLDS